MVRQYYDRYSEFKKDGSMTTIPFITIPRKSTDFKVVYDGKTRLDIISNDYYNNPNMGWLILLANPQFGGMEFDIPNGTVLTVPYPLQQSLADYEKAIIRYGKLYGI
jgi:hypothetical protein